MEMDEKAMRALLDAFDQSDWQEMTVTVGGDRLHVSRQPARDGAPSPQPTAAVVPAGEEAAAPPPSPPPPAPDRLAPDPAPGSPSAGASPAGAVVDSPSVGLFWRAPSPGATPFVEVGGTVSEGDTVWLPVR